MQRDTKTLIIIAPAVFKWELAGAGGGKPTSRSATPSSIATPYRRRRASIPPCLFFLFFFVSLLLLLLHRPLSSVPRQEQATPRLFLQRREWRPRRRLHQQPTGTLVTATTAAWLSGRRCRGAPSAPPPRWLDLPVSLRIFPCNNARRFGGAPAVCSASSVSAILLPAFLHFLVNYYFITVVTTHILLFLEIGNILMRCGPHSACDIPSIFACS
jgi:hypothetical protein